MAVLLGPGADLGGVRVRLRSPCPRAAILGAAGLAPGGGVGAQGFAELLGVGGGQVDLVVLAV